MKILITGTAGFIGYHLSKKLVERGNIVIGIDQINDYYDIELKYSRLKDLGIEKNEIEEGKKITSSVYENHFFYKGNLEDKDFIDSVFKSEKLDAVCNLAAQAGVRYSLKNPKAYIDSNIVGFINILEACRHNGVENLSYASSSSVYGLNKSLPFSTKDNVDHPVSLYAASKKSNELMAHTYSHLFGIRATGLRFFTVYGPFGRPDMALFLFTKAAIENGTIDVFNHGKMIRDFTYVDDIVKGIMSVIDNPAESSPNFDTNPLPNYSSAPYKIYNIGNNSPVKLMDFIVAIEKKIGKKVKKNFMEIQPGDVPETYADVRDLENDFNYKPNTSIDFGISKFIDWYKNYYGES
jgi:UDP-glucuronate 4-epimerase